jgi:hypothetical protein
MNQRNCLILFGVAALLSVYCAEVSTAAVFLRSLPQDGSQVLFSGVLRVTQPSPESSDQTMTTEWLQQITISSVGSESVEMSQEDGQTVAARACRWIEFKVERGKATDKSDFDVGQAGVIIYKCLIPEDAVGNEPSDFIPIVRGWRKIGDEEPQPMNGQVLRIAPIITLLDHYDNAQDQPSETLQVKGLGEVQCAVTSGTRQFQGRTGRAANQGQVWVSDKVPFGLMKWRASTRREQLLGSLEGGEYRFASELFTEMTIFAGRGNAQSELPQHN